MFVISKKYNKINNNEPSIIGPNSVGRNSSSKSSSSLSSSSPSSSSALSLSILDHHNFYHHHNHNNKIIQVSSSPKFLWFLMITVIIVISMISFIQCFDVDVVDGNGGDGGGKSVVGLHNVPRSSSSTAAAATTTTTTTSIKNHHRRHNDMNHHNNHVLNYSSLSASSQSSTPLMTMTTTRSWENAVVSDADDDHHHQHHHHHQRSAIASNDSIVTSTDTDDDTTSDSIVVPSSSKTTSTTTTETILTTMTITSTSTTKKPKINTTTNVRNNNNKSKPIQQNNNGGGGVGNNKPNSNNNSKQQNRPSTNNRKNNNNNNGNHNNNHHRHNRGNNGKRKHGPPLSSTTPKPQNEMIIEYDLHRTQPKMTCLIGDTCGENDEGFCYRPHEPIHYEIDDEETENFLEMLSENCPHFFDENDELRHPLCCTAEMEETMSKLIMNVDLIRRSCPSCLTNVKKLFCNLFCSPNQNDFIRIDRIKDDMVTDVTYAISEIYMEKFFQSCYDVKVFGAYLMDFESACGKLKRSNCTAIEFLRSLGSLREIPFHFRPLIISQQVEEKIIELDIDRWPRHIMNDSAYYCDEAPPNQSTCRCEHCSNMCLLSNYNPHKVTINSGATTSFNGNNDLASDSVQQPNQRQRQQSNYRINVRHVGSKNNNNHNHNNGHYRSSSSSLLTMFLPNNLIFQLLFLYFLNLFLF